MFHARSWNGRCRTCTVRNIFGSYVILLISNIYFRAVKLKYISDSYIIKKLSDGVKSGELGGRSFTNDKKIIPLLSKNIENAKIKKFTFLYVT